MSQEIYVVVDPVDGIIFNCFTTESVAQSWAENHTELADEVRGPFSVDTDEETPFTVVFEVSKGSTLVIKSVATPDAVSNERSISSELLGGYTVYDSVAQFETDPRTK